MILIIILRIMYTSYVVLSFHNPTPKLDGHTHCDAYIYFIGSIFQIHSNHWCVLVFQSNTYLSNDTSVTARLVYYEYKNNNLCIYFKRDPNINLTLVVW